MKQKSENKNIVKNNLEEKYFKIIFAKKILDRIFRRISLEKSFKKFQCYFQIILLDMKRKELSWAKYSVYIALSLHWMKEAFDFK